MDLLMNFQNLVKSKIRFTTVDGDYEGVVRLVCPVTKKIIIEQLFFLPKHLSIGVLHFNISEILSCKIISQTQVHAKEESAVFNMIHTKKNTELYSERVPEDIPKEERYILKLPQWPNVILPTDSVILDCLNEQFHQAIAHIQQQGNIGVFLGGPTIGRDGILSWLSITTPNCIFLFDIQSLKEKAFQKGGLKEVLENTRIEKILHDCRNASDCLYHQFDTKLINVFDTQVADLFVALQSNKKSTIPQKVNTLDFCLAKYLDVPNSFLPKNKHRSHIESFLHCRLRPLRNETRDLLVKSVIYLRLLKQRLNRLLLNPFHRAVEVYLQVVQSASDRELLLEPPSDVEVPLQLMMDGLQTVRFRDSSSGNTIENYANLYKNNSGKNTTTNTCNSSGFSKLFYQNEVNLAAGYISPNVESCDDLCKSNKYKTVKDYIIDNDNSTNFCKLPQVNIATRHMQDKLSDNIKLSTVNFGDCSSIDESLSQTDTNVPHRLFQYKNTEALGHSGTGVIINNSSNMKFKHIFRNSDFLNKSREISNKDKFELSHLKFNDGLFCQVKQERVGDDNPKVEKNNLKAAYIESTPLSKNKRLNDREKSKGLPNLREDPYAKLREAFSVPYEKNEERKKLNFFPAGMANIS